MSIQKRTLKRVFMNFLVLKNFEFHILKIEENLKKSNESTFIKGSLKI